MTKLVGLTQFVSRQTKMDFVGTKLTAENLEDLIGSVEAQLINGIDVFPGYAPFCKVVVITNLGHDIKASYVHVDDIGLQNDMLGTAGYESRIPSEPAMPVTPSVHWHGPLPKAQYLHVVIYSREQLKSEGTDFSGADWDIVTVNAEMEKTIVVKDGVEQIVGAPMTPSTMIRNHLGKEWGGSGKPINMDEYKASVEFWSEHCLIK